jgi:hypothetical protein
MTAIPNAISTTPRSNMPLLQIERGHVRTNRGNTFECFGENANGNFGKHYEHRRAFQCPPCQTSYTILMASNHYFQNPPIVTNGIDIGN